MRLPFGLDFKSLIVGLLLAYFVIPWVMAFVGGIGKGSKTD